LYCIVNPSGETKVASSFYEVRIVQSLVFFVVFCKSMPFVLYLYVIVLFVLRFTASDYPFDIFKLFFNVLF